MLMADTWSERSYDLKDEEYRVTLSWFDIHTLLNLVDREAGENDLNAYDLRSALTQAVRVGDVRE